MAERDLGRLDVDVFGDQSRGVGPSQVVEGEAFEPSGLAGREPDALAPVGVIDHSALGLDHVEIDGRASGQPDASAGRSKKPVCFHSRAHESSEYVVLPANCPRSSALVPAVDQALDVGRRNACQWADTESRQRVQSQDGLRPRASHEMRNFGSAGLSTNYSRPSSFAALLLRRG